MKTIAGAAIGGFVGCLVLRAWGAAIGAGLGAWGGSKL